MGRSVYIAYTGGTIGMTRKPGGYAPAPGFLEAQMRQMPELQSQEVPAFAVHQYEPLLDSANMAPADWNAIAEDIAQNYAKYDGFVVLHGTDTMAYTAAALSFMLEGLAKPVVMTGSQIPIGELRNDARGNLITSLLVAGMRDLAEVFLCFNGKLLRGNRAVKVSATGLMPSTRRTLRRWGRSGSASRSTTSACAGLRACRSACSAAAPAPWPRFGFSRASPPRS